MQTVEIKHSAIGASSRSRWRECPGSVKLCAGLPPKTNEYAQTGSYYHEVASQILNDPKKRAFYEMVEPIEHLEAVLTYVDLIESECKTATLLRIEYPFDMAGLFPGLFGTCDAYAFFKDEKILRVYDYKHGSGKFVPVEQNVQLLYYSLGALIELPFAVDTIELVIVQPRCPRFKRTIHRWSYPVTDVYGYINDLVREASATEAPDAPLKTGDHCFFCPAVEICPAKFEERKAKARKEFSPVTAEEKQQITNIKG